MLACFFSSGTACQHPSYEVYADKDEGYQYQGLDWYKQAKKLQTPALKYRYTLSNDFCYFAYGKLCIVSVGIVIEKPA